MSRLPAYLSALRRKSNLALPSEPEDDSRDSIFNLLPPRSYELKNSSEPSKSEEPVKPAEQSEPAAQSESETAGETTRNVRPVGAMDLTRLSIDNDGRLYWDGKPVEVRRRIMMSRAQIVGASIVAAFVVIGAVGAAIQGSAAARDWACRLGWTQSYCTTPDAKPLSAPRTDIPA
jgi:hypothetical protein